MHRPQGITLLRPHLRCRISWAKLREGPGGFVTPHERCLLLQKRVVEELQKVLTKDDAAPAARAVLNDAGTYDVATQTGGLNGSVRFE